MKKNNRILSFLLALVMIITLLPATVLAEGETDVMKGWSITLGDDIGVKFYLDSADYAVTATVDGEAVVPAISGNIATVNVAAAQMNDPIVLTVADEDRVVYTGKYTVRQYGLTILNGDYAEEAKNMVRYMLNYGGAAQTYFNHYADKLANTGITVPEITMPAEAPNISLTDELDGINFYGASLVMRNKTAVRFYFRVTGDVGSFTFSQGTAVLKDDLYYVEIDGINPQDYAEDITLSVNDGALSVTYSPLTYIARMYSNAESSNEMKALVKAMCGYHLAAVDYQDYLEAQHTDHIWIDATCTEPKTCSICGEKEGTVAAHSYADGICTVCGIPEIIRTQWDMSNYKHAADWSGYHSKKENEALTTTVTEDGLVVDYLSPGNGWKGVVLKKTLIGISDLTGKLTFTYSSDMTITSYRIHILTGLGGSLTSNGTADCYVEASLTDITNGNLAAWTQTTNDDGSITVTFDLSSMGHFTAGNVLKGLTIVTVTANETPGTVTYKSIALELDIEGHDCQADGHIMKEATCTEPKTCYVCGATEGEALGHAWVEATCTEPKNCPVCYAIEGEALGHAWVEATCTSPKTCSVCGTIEGEKLGHTDADEDLVCDVCTDNLTIWNMNNPADAINWSGYHSKMKNEALTTTVTEDGLAVNYLSPGNGWKGLVLEEAAIDISKLTGKLSFTYSSDMTITNYRIHLVTDLGGNLTANGTVDCYTVVSIADITAGNLEAWTQTANEDGSVTVTFDLSSMGYFANGTELRGLTIVTVTANNTPGTVTYKSIEIEKIPEGYDCETEGHIWQEATCTEPKTCSVCGATEGEALGHTWIEATCTEPQICSVCDTIEGEALGHAWVDATCTSPKTCSACGTTEGTAAGHSFVEGVCSACGATEAALATPVVWDMSVQADASQWYCAQAYTEVREHLTYSQLSTDGFTAYYGHKNAWKGIILKNTEIDITNLSGLLSFTYNTEDLDITEYRIHILTDQGGDLGSNTSGTPSNYYVAVKIANIAQSEAWTRTVNADGSITVTFDLTTLPFFAEGTVLMGMDIVTVANSTTGEWRAITYSTISIS